MEFWQFHSFGLIRNLRGEFQKTKTINFLGCSTLVRSPKNKSNQSGLLYIYLELWTLKIVFLRAENSKTKKISKISDQNLTQAHLTRAHLM